MSLTLYMWLFKDMYDTYENDTAKYRILLEKWSPKLHPNHFQVKFRIKSKQEKVSICLNV